MKRSLALGFVCLFVVVFGITQFGYAQQYEGRLTVYGHWYNVYEGEGDELFMTRYVYLKVEESDWILSDISETQE